MGRVCHRLTGGTGNRGVTQTPQVTPLAVTVPGGEWWSEATVRGARVPSAGLQKMPCYVKYEEYDGMGGIGVRRALGHHWPP